MFPWRLRTPPVAKGPFSGAAVHHQGPSGTEGGKAPTRHRPLLRLSLRWQWLPPLPLLRMRLPLLQLLGLPQMLLCRRSRLSRDQNDDKQELQRRLTNQRFVPDAEKLWTWSTLELTWSFVATSSSLPPSRASIAALKRADWRPRSVLAWMTRLGRRRRSHACIGVSGLAAWTSSRRLRLCCSAAVLRSCGSRRWRSSPTSNP
mmetsp:Transcript_122669/g.392744  ORF Transcript_122669/g.392744 Transcript_122669/m.392744 type:complete len:203 (-) Transcript_122669:346-954(-)